MNESAQVISERLADSLTQSPFQKLLGLSLESVEQEAQAITLRCAYGPNVERGAGSDRYHGGAIASLVDIAGDYALMAVLGYGVPTINFRVDYLRAAFDTDLIARACVRRCGRSIGVVDIEVLDAQGRLIALGRACYSTQENTA